MIRKRKFWGENKHLDRLETLFRFNFGSVPLDMCEHNESHSDLKQLSLEEVNLARFHLTALVHSTQQQAPKDHFSTGQNGVQHLPVSVSRSTLQQSVQPLNFTLSVCGVQHLGRVTICPNVDDSFHLLTEPSEPRSQVVGLTEIPSICSHDFRRNFFFGKLLLSKNLF